MLVTQIIADRDEAVPGRMDGRILRTDLPSIAGSVDRSTQILTCSGLGIRTELLQRGDEMDPYPEGDLTQELVSGEDLHLVGAVLLDDRHDVEHDELVQRRPFDGER